MIYASAQGVAFNLYFLFDNEEDNREIVEESVSFFGYIGNIYKSKGAIPQQRRPKQQDSACTGFLKLVS